MKKKQVFFEDAIKDLGNSADKIAKKLKSLKIRGHRNEADICPIGNYLTEKGFEDVAVYQSGIDARLSGNGYSFTFTITPSKAIESFITRFDNGKYPELDADATGQ